MNNNIFKNLSYGVYIVSCQINGKYTGCTVNSIMQITSNPAVIALSVNHNNYTHICLEQTKRFAVSILSEESAPISIGTFGFRSGRDFNKFENIPYSIINGLPVIKDACGYLICEIKDKTETDTHTLFIANVLDGDLLNNKTPMTYAYYHNVIKGKSPKSAPTYIE
ncbi:MAG: flavin reductase family protein [Candidatus Gastranaerophilales bacterium]|nr:flavin reductase family protein [Candidatus Gastranaerophilales bacterium]